MAKGIYLLKIFIFREQFQLTSFEEKSIRRITIFIIFIYLKFWFQAPNPTDAPLNDLIMLKILENYEEIDSVLSKIAQTKFKNHLRYLSEYLAPLVFFQII